MTDARTQGERCIHNVSHSVEAAMNYMEDTGQFMIDVKVTCAQCGQPFRFLGLPLGLNMSGATMDVDGLQARLALAPADRTLHPLEGLTGFGVKAS